MADNRTKMNSTPRVEFAKWQTCGGNPAVVCVLLMLSTSYQIVAAIQIVPELSNKLDRCCLPRQVLERLVLCGWRSVLILSLDLSSATTTINSKTSRFQLRIGQLVVACCCSGRWSLDRAERWDYKEWSLLMCVNFFVVVFQLERMLECVWEAIQRSSQHHGKLIVTVSLITSPIWTLRQPYQSTSFYTIYQP
jgi:hypothetical protein